MFGFKAENIDYYDFFKFINSNSTSLVASPRPFSG